MTAVLDLPPIDTDQGEQARRWRRIPARTAGHERDVRWARLFESLEEAAADGYGCGWAGTILLVRCDGDGTPLCVDGAQSQYPNASVPKAARQWGERYGVTVVEPIKDYSTAEVREYLPVLTEVAKPTGETWRGYTPPTGRRHGE